VRGGEGEQREGGRGREGEQRKGERASRRRKR